MYAWRCWREFRFRFFGYLSLLLVISLAGPLAVTVKKSPQGERKVYARRLRMKSGSSGSRARWPCWVWARWG